MSLSRDPEKTLAWKRRGAKNYEDNLREQGRKFSDMKRSGIKPVNEERREKEWARAYGSEERVRFVKDLPCAVPGCGDSPSENAHLETGGMGRKADADTVVPLCAAHHRELDDELGSVDLFDCEHGTDLWATAEKVEEMWSAQSSA